ncbi:hypothetical protein BpHYR1_021486 [Brachionus plicatilis]|uniref:Uncharacterized protein n=1 Tax=Brachionus plicatilis TaxID=10195 RepID=A0A3M7Q3D8_BRAPC|nr:hypothetical protein BpHYR1_021486 [Brachionus plicatilis]
MSSAKKQKINLNVIVFQTFNSILSNFLSQRRNNIWIIKNIIIRILMKNVISHFYIHLLKLRLCIFNGKIRSLDHPMFMPILYIILKVIILGS